MVMSNKAKFTNNRHILGNAVLYAANDRGHVGAVPLALSAVGREDAFDSLARFALRVNESLREGRVGGGVAGVWGGER